ncbi:hypothetical protein EDD16DRAFT_1577704 [Pisolithus croceorrhizus]|nr:hypothetical protein EDD16DRAFT_1577704 [Pisolithus croceorrhizus]
MSRPGEMVILAVAVYCLVQAASNPRLELLCVCTTPELCVQSTGIPRLPRPGSRRRSHSVGPRKSSLSTTTSPSPSSLHPP